MTTRAEILAQTDYEPYDNRVRPGQTNRLETLVNLIKGILGTGIMALPEAFKNSGLLVGSVGILLITAAITYCLHLLFQSMHFFCKRDKIPQINYPDTLKQAFLVGPECMRKFADSGPYMVNFFIILYQMGTCCIYIIFCASNIKQVVDQHTDNGNYYSVEFYMCCFLIPILLISYIPNLKWLYPFNQVANWLTLGGLVCIYYFFFTPPGDMSERNAFSPIQRMPLFIGTAMFAVLSIGPILSIENSMKNAKYWLGITGILSQGMFICTILNLFTGFCGYWKYGEDTKAVITLNLDITHGLAQALRILFSSAIYISFATQCYPVVEIFWDQYCQDYMGTTKRRWVWEYMLRTILVCIAFIPGVTIPHINLFISLFGAFCLSVLGIIFPAWIDISIRWSANEFGKKRLILVRDILLIIFGLCGWSFGTYSAFRGIIEKLIEG